MMFRFTIRELVVLTLVVAIGVGWWLDHRMADYECNSRCNPIIEYADRMTLVLTDAKSRLGIVEEILIKLHVQNGGDEQAIRKALDEDDTVNWGILDEQKPYSYH